MKKIPLTGKWGVNKFALVSNVDYKELSKYKWFLGKNGYPARNVGRPSLSPIRIYMHRVILGFPDLEVDHINRNRLDNRRENLRTATRSQNAHNTGPQINNTSGYRGVYWYKAYKKWEADIKVQGKKIKLGYFKDIEDAASIRYAAKLQLTEGV